MTVIIDIANSGESVNSSGNHHGKDSVFFRIAYLGLCYSVLYTAVNVSQSFITSQFPGSFGFNILLILYLTFAIASLLASPLNIWLVEQGWCREVYFEQRAMFIGSVLGFVFVLCLQLGVGGDGLFSIMVVIVGAVLAGLSFGLMWTSQGTWTTKVIQSYHHNTNATIDDKTLETKSNIVGRAMGVFFTLYNTSGIVGNLISVVALQFGSSGSFETLGWIMLGISGLGVVMFSQVPPAPDPYSKSEPDSTLEQNDSIGWIEKYRMIFRKPETWLLTPYLCSQGMFISFSFANFPNIVNYLASQQYQRQSEQERSWETAEKYASINIAYCFLSYAIGCLIASYGWGVIYDRCKGRLRPLIYWYLALTLQSFGLLYYATEISSSNTYPVVPVMIWCAFSMGLIVVNQNAIINNSFAETYKPPPRDLISTAFAWYRFVSGVSFASNAVISVAIPRNTPLEMDNWILISIVIQLVGIFVSAIGGVIFDNRRNDVAKQTEQSMPVSLLE